MIAPIDQLAGRVARVRSRASGGGFDRSLLVVGGLLLPLGGLVIVLGWMGASQTVLLFEQIPYLVSGGFLGLALVFAGGFVYFTYWQTLAVREARIANRELIASLGRIEALLSGGTAIPIGDAQPLGLVATPAGTMAHRRECVVVATRSDVRPATAADGLEPCQLCQPPSR
ncbi:MAG: hypothetical protein NVSMB12_05090 [Acidimicrobiales bacterium]